MEYLEQQLTLLLSEIEASLILKEYHNHYNVLNACEFIQQMEAYKANVSKYKDIRKHGVVDQRMLNDLNLQKNELLQNEIYQNYQVCERALDTIVHTISASVNVLFQSEEKHGCSSHKKMKPTKGR